MLDPALPPAPGFRARAALARAALAPLTANCVGGEVAAVVGLGVALRGLSAHLAVGDRLLLAPRGGVPVPAEVVGFRDGLAHALALGPLDGLGPGRPAFAAAPPRPATLAVDDAWLGRVIDPLGRPLDGARTAAPGVLARPVRAAPPAATARARLGPRLGFGVRALDAFVPAREGQRLGLFAGAGVGKSTLLGMLARGPPATSPCSPWSASGAARCVSSWRTIWAPRAWRAPWRSSPPPTPRRCCGGRPPMPP